MQQSGLTTWFPKILDNFWLSAREVPIKYNLCKLDLMKIVCLKTLNSIYIIFAETLLKEKFHLRTQHSVLLGYWTTELGGLNQVVHLWQYGQYHTKRCCQKYPGKYYFVNVRCLP